MRGWYQEAANHAPPPAQVTLERITAERDELYRAVPPPGETIPISMPPSPIGDFVPIEEGKMLGSEERDIATKEGTADGGEERGLTKW